jgi:ankyrin repeat protein
VEKLAKAVKSGRISEIERLVKVEKLPIDYLDADYGHSILMLAVIYNLNASVEKLLQLDANPNLRSVIKQGMDSSYITTPMFLATNSILKKNFCDTKTLQLLIKYGGKVDDELEVRYVGATYITKETPLMAVCKGRCLNVVKLLIDSGADIDRYDYNEGHGPITNAIIHDRMNIAKYLIIEKKARIPKYCYVVQAHNETLRKEIGVYDFLLKANYEESSENFKIRQEILKYLEKTSRTN